MRYKIVKKIISTRKWVEDNENIVVNTLTTIIGIGVFTLGVFLIGILEEITR